jgi:hypothetical protein
MLSNGTEAIVRADHCAHTTKAGGNHRTLLPGGMYIPIFAHYV